MIGISRLVASVYYYIWCCDQGFFNLRLLHKDTQGVVLYLVAVIRGLRPVIVLFILKKLSNAKDNRKKLENTPVKTLWSKQQKRKNCLNLIYENSLHLYPTKILLILPISHVWNQNGWLPLNVELTGYSFVFQC